jgi:tape measure domain-containing protein
MSGVIIDVETNTDRAKRDLGDLNRSIKNMVLSAGRTKNVLAVDGSKVKAVTQDVQASTAAMKSMGNVTNATMHSIANSTRSLTRDVGFLRTGVVALGASFAALQGMKAFGQMSDDLTNAQNRIKLVVKDTDQLLRKQREIFKLSQQSRTTNSSTANLYVDMTRSLKKRNDDDARIMRAVETIQKAGTMSGSSMETLTASLEQLSQGLSSGRISGDELRSVLEGLKYLGTGVADALGKTTGELRETGLAVEDFMAAVEKMADKTDSDFKRTTVTLASGSAVMRQAISYTIGDLNQYLGVAVKFAQGLVKNAQKIAGTSDQLIQMLTGVRASARNYMNDMLAKKPFEINLKTFLNVSLNPFDAQAKASQKKKVKNYLEQVRDLFADEEELAVNIKPVGLEKLFSRLKLPKGEADEATKRVTEAKSLRVRVQEVIDLSAAMFDSLQVTARETIRLLPTIHAPLGRYTDAVKRFVGTTAIDLDAWMASSILPTIRGLEAFSEVLTLFKIGDSRVERATANLFRSKSLEEFNENLFKLNRARESLKLDDKRFLGSVFLYRLKNTGDELETFLMRLGLMRSRLQVRLPVREIERELETIGTVARRFYTDIFMPHLQPILRKATLQLRILGDNFLDILRGTFNATTGRDLGTLFGKAVALGIRGTITAIKKLRGADVFDMDDAVVVVRAAFLRVIAFIKAFVKSAAA